MGNGRWALCPQETDSASAAAPGAGGSGFIVAGALHIAWSRCDPLFFPGEWPGGPG